MQLVQSFWMKYDFLMLLFGAPRRAKPEETANGQALRGSIQETTGPRVDSPAAQTPTKMQNFAARQV